MQGNVAQEAPGRLLALTFLVGTVLGLLGVVLWVTVVDDGDAALRASSTSVADRSERQGGDDRRGGDDSQSPQAVADTRSERCAGAAEALAAPLEAARPALEQWEVHVEAMNQLVVGEISLQQATRFWNQTRLGAQRNVERFRVAWTKLERRGIDCPRPVLMGPAPATVRSCSRLVEAQLGIAQAAKTSIDTWDTHVQHMDMLRMGSLSPERATEMWLDSWRSGVRDLRTYRQATRNPALEMECPQASS